MLASTELNSRPIAIAIAVAKPSPMAAMPAWMYRLLGVRPAPPLPQPPVTAPNPRLKVSGLSAGSTFRCYPR